MPARIFDELPLNGENVDVTLKGTTEPENVVISGISGRLPESDNIEEFRQHLRNNEDMVTENNRRWEPGMHGLPRRSGKLKDISKFDAAMFGVHPKQANAMDPQLRMLLEVTYEAIADAGVNPLAVKGSRTGVFIGCSASEAHDAWSNDLDKIVGYEMTGCTRSMFANRLSYFFDFKGPSFAIDTACSSSLLALDQALHSIRDGLCEAAIVGGASLCLNPATTLQFQKLGMLATDGTCKSFDAKGDGYCRSEAIVAIYLQKEKSAKRIYATLVHSKSNSDGNKKEGITFPSGEVQKRLLSEVYKEAGVDPSQVAYVEAHGTGTKAGDPQEVNTIADVFCTGRQGPLLIGSTKSNMGHPEPASGLAAVAKVIIAMEDGVIPANLHYTAPNPDIPALTEGSLKVVSENMPWNGGYASINSFGFGGSNVHVLLKSNKADPNPPHLAAKATRLVTLSGRTEEAVQSLLHHLQQDAENVELQALAQQLADTPTTTHPYRGYALINSENTATTIQKCALGDRPVWYVFAGMGTQWHGMGRDMMELDVFRESIMKSDAVLKPYDLNLYDIIMTGESSVFEDTQLSFVGIAAIQVALVDVLKSFGIEPEGIVGHSVGELGCAYADGCLTGEEVVLAAYWRGRCVKEAELPPGGMAAVGLTWEEARNRCPEGVVPACHNSADTQTISGPAEAVSEFVAQLKQEGIFAKEVQSAGVAFHSYFMAKTAPALREALRKVIHEPRLRTSRWASSSIPEAHWDSDLAKYSSADYHVNNLVSPVLFQEALQHVPDNAIVIEIAPHCLLQAVLKRSLSPNCTIVGLMKRNQVNNVEFLFTSLGKCYNAGMTLDSLGIFPSLNYPVSRGTGFLSSLVQWDHSQQWNVPKVEQFITGGAGGKSGCVFEVDMSDNPEQSYLTGHKIEGRVLHPATGYLVLVWKALAKINRQVYREMPVTFEDVHIHRATILPKNGSVKFEVMIMPGSGEFEVCENGAQVVSGKVFSPEEPINQIPVTEPQTSSPESNYIQLTGSDVYKELRLRGYEYGPSFQGILSASNFGHSGYLKWTSNWVSFLDSILQIQVLRQTGLRLPTRIKRLTIDPAQHNEKIIDIDSENKALKVIVDTVLDVATAGGAQIMGLHATVAPRRQQQQTAPTLEKYQFVPYTETQVQHNKDLVSYVEASKTYLKNAMVNMLDKKVNGNMPNVEQLKSVFNSSDMTNIKDSREVEGGFLNTLKKVISLPNDDAFVTNAHNILQQNAAELLSDRLLSNQLCERSLKPVLDVVLENSTMAKLKIVEVTSGHPAAHPIFHKVVTQLNTQPLLQIDYTITGTNLDSLDQDKLQSLDIKSVPWNFTDAFSNQFSSLDLIVISNTLYTFPDAQLILDQMKSTLKDTGFILVHEATCNFFIPMCLQGLTRDFSGIPSRKCGPFNDAPSWLEEFEHAGLQQVAMKSDSLLSTLFLLRKNNTDNRGSFKIINIDDLTFKWVDTVKQAMNEVNLEDRLYLVSESMPHSGIVGMVNCLSQEQGGQQIRCVFNADKPVQALTGEMWAEIRKKDLVMNVFKRAEWGSFRHLPLQDANSESTISTNYAYINVLTRGDLSTLRWIESPLKYFSHESHPGKQLCSVYYTSLNFRDIMLATGRLPPDAIPGNIAMQDCILGMEFSGRDQTGRRIMGLLPAKGLATVVDVDERFLWDVPKMWNLQESASVPVVYATAYYALVVRGQIRQGEKVLIHSGSGGVGQAAIAIALHHHCQVFTTVGSQEKREYLKKRFPQLTDDHISNSRNTSFEWDILQATRGKGVDVILNSLSEDKMQASIRLLAPHGRFLEIGKFDLSNNTPLGMSLFLKNISFHGILLDALFEEGNSDWEVVSGLLTQGIKDGCVKPLNTTLFDKEDIEDAFRFMAQGKHIGKVVVKVREEETEFTSPTPVTVAAIPRCACHPDKSYIIIGGLGGFGLELCNWLIERGAMKVVLTSRSGIKTGYQSRYIRLWREAGVDVKVSTDNVRSLKETKSLLQEAAKMGPVGGIFNLAMVLRDGLMENQTVENFYSAAEPKVTGTLNLDVASREICPDSLDWFVVYSSVSCGRGNAGQANYGFANSSMERICEKRREDGFPGLAIQWGAVGDVGVVLDTMGNNDTVIGGTMPQRIQSCLATIDTFLNQLSPVVSSFVLAEKKSKSSMEQSNKTDLVESVAHILGVQDVSSVPSDATLGELGLDSLMGVEVKQTLERDYEIVMAMKEIRLLTITKLKDLASGAFQSSGAEEKLTNSKPDVGSNHISDNSITVRYDLAKMMPSQNIIQMNDVQGDKPKLFIIHPIEGVVTSLQTLASKLECPVYGLQCTVDTPATSVEEMAKHYIQQIKTIQSSGPYHLAGYSFGAMIACEMVKQLQVNSESVVSLTLLDGSHSYVSAHIQQYQAKLAKTMPGDLAREETEALCAFMLQFTQIDYQKMIEKMMSLPDRGTRIEFCAEQMMSLGLFPDKVQLAQCISSFINKLVISGEYKLSTILHVNVTMIKASSGHAEAESLGDDYGLKEVCDGNIDIHTVQGDHESFIQNNGAIQVAKIINNKL